jgi:aryl-alcohol dehydrogenase-like predicted oxidoreductase
VAAEQFNICEPLLSAMRPISSWKSAVSYSRIRRLLSRRSSHSSQEFALEFRTLGRSGLKVPVLCFGTGTFGGGTEFFRAWGETDVKEARQLVDLCMEAGVNFFDTADIYSNGLSEEILGQAIKHLPRENVLISTKTTFPMTVAKGETQDPNSFGSSRYHITYAIEASLKRLKTDYIDIYHMHGFDALTPIEETLNTLDKLVREGKVRYIAASNFSGWHLQKSIDVSERYGWARYVAHQVYYSLIGRDYEWELMPQAVEEKIGALIWSPLGWGRLTGKIRRGQPLPVTSRLHTAAAGGPEMEDEYLYTVVDALDKVAAEVGKSVPQVALNWLLQRPTVSSVIIGARNEEQLKANLEAASFNLTALQVETLDRASQTRAAYPYWHQHQFQVRNPLPVKRY